MVGKNYKLTADSMNVIINVRKKRTGENTSGRKPNPENIGKDYWVPTYYFSTVKNALHWIVELEVNLTGLSDLKAIDAKIDELHDMIDRLNISIGGK